MQTTGNQGIMRTMKRCSYCHKPVPSGRSRCPKHMVYLRLQMRERRRLWALIPGCRDCGRPRLKTGVYCRRCRLRHRAYDSASRRRQIAQGLCPHCHIRPVIGKTHWCWVCKARHGRRMIAQRLERQVAGRCTKCGKKLDKVELMQRYRRCARCSWCGSRSRKQRKDL